MDSVSAMVERGVAAGQTSWRPSSGVWRLASGNRRLATTLYRPTPGLLACEQEQLGGEGTWGQGAGHRLKPLAFRMRSVRIEAHGQSLDERRPVRSFQGIQPRMPLGYFPTGQTNPDHTVEPARIFGQPRQEWLAQKQTLARRGNSPKSQSPSLVALVQHDTPGVGRALVPVPIEDSDKLFA
jgi:hypothetical protein